MAEDESTRRGDDPNGDQPSDRNRPIRASGRARLRGLDGVRRDDVRLKPQTPGHPDPETSDGEGTGRASAPEQAADERSADPQGTAPQGGGMPQYPTRRARREALGRRLPQRADSDHGDKGGSRGADHGPDDAPELFSGSPADTDPDELPAISPRHAARQAQRTDAAPDSSEPLAGPDAEAPANDEGPQRRRTRSEAAASAPASARERAPASATSRRIRRDSRPRHSRREGEAFGSIVRWTTLGTLLPGVGLIRGNHRRGWLVLIGFLAIIAAAAVWVVWRSPVRAVARVAGSPTILYVIAAVLAVGLVIWAITILRSYRVLRKGKRITPLQRSLGWSLVASLILCVGIPLGVGSVYSKVQADTIVQVFGRSGGAVQAKEDLWADQPRINVFLIGRDNGDGREGTRPDTMLVASIDTASGDTTLISVPRNLNRAHFPDGSQLAERFPMGFDGFGPDESLINAVWTWAEQNPEEVGEVSDDLEVGMEATMQAVEGSLGVDLDYYASVDMQGFEDVVDSIGGVKIDVERPVPIGGGTNMETGLKNPINDWIDPGEQVLKGKNALWYVRSRDGADNYDRMCRQQRMLKTTIDQINPHELAAAYPKLAGSAERNVLTDIGQHEVPAFVELAVAMQRGEIKSAQINNEVTSTVSPDYDTLHEWVQEQIDPAEPSQAEEEVDAASAEEEAPEEEEPTEEETGAPEDGVEDTEGKCYPQGYEPGSGWPGWPGPSEDE